MDLHAWHINLWREISKKEKDTGLHWTRLCWFMTHQQLLFQPCIANTRSPFQSLHIIANMKFHLMLIYSIIYLKLRSKQRHKNTSDYGTASWAYIFILHWVCHHHFVGTWKKNIVWFNQRSRLDWNKCHAKEHMNRINALMKSNGLFKDIHKNAALFVNFNNTKSLKRSKISENLHIFKEHYMSNQKNGIKDMRNE